MEIIFSKQAAKFLQKQTPETRKRIRSAIERIPLGDIKKLTGQPYYRLRVGDFRVVFDRDGNIIEVIKIDNRGQVYR